MTRRTFFLSYSRRDADAASALAAELDRFGQEVWLDRDLSGGQIWWDAILEQIKSCDCFVFAQSRTSIESKACMSELAYAHDLGKPILPVLVADSPPDNLLPRYLAEAQRVDARDRENLTHALARALFALPDAPVLPDPLPPAPPVPISYLDTLAERASRSELDLSDQRVLLADIKQYLAPDREPEAAQELLRSLRKRDDLYASVGSEIDEILRLAPPPVAHAAAAAAASAPSPSAQTEPATVPPARRHPRWLVALAVFGAIVLALIVLGALMAPDCYYDIYGQYVCE